MTSAQLAYTDKVLEYFLGVSWQAIAEQRDLWSEIQTTIECKFVGCATIDVLGNFSLSPAVKTYILDSSSLSFNPLAGQRDLWFETRAGSNQQPPNFRIWSL